MSHEPKTGPIQIPRAVRDRVKILAALRGMSQKDLIAEILTAACDEAGVQKIEPDAKA